MSKNKFIKLLISAFFLRAVFSFLVWHPDVNSNIDWGTRIWQYGFKAFYDPDTNVWSYTWPNQPPGTAYIFAFMKKVDEIVFNFFWNINIKVPFFPSNVMYYLEGHLFPAISKLPSILADFGIAWLIYKNVKDNKLRKFAVALWLFNPVVWYNSSIWGQTDAVVSFLVFLSFYLLSKNRALLSVFFYALSIYTKASLLIFIPFYILLLIGKRFPLKTYFLSFVISFVLIILFTIPFSKGNPVVWLYYLYQGKVFVQQLQVITANAFNIWTTIASIHERPQTQMLGPLSYQVWGTLLYALSYFLIFWFYMKSKVKNIFYVLSLIAFSSFMLLTNMHERYLYPLFPFYAVIVVQNRKLLIVYILVSLISLLNLYNFWWFPRIELVVNFLSFSNRLMPRILGFVMFFLYLFLFLAYLRQTKASRL